jgi:hypothetical protein
MVPQWIPNATPCNQVNKCQRIYSWTHPVNPPSSKISLRTESAIDHPVQQYNVQRTTKIIAQYIPEKHISKSPCQTTLLLLIPADYQLQAHKTTKKILYF